MVRAARLVYPIIYQCIVVKLHVPAHLRFLEAQCCNTNGLSVSSDDLVSHCRACKPSYYAYKTQRHRLLKFALGDLAFW